MKNKLISMFLMWTLLLLSIGIGNVSSQTISADKRNEITQQNVQNPLLDELKFEFAKKLNFSSGNVLEEKTD